MTDERRGTGNNINRRFLNNEYSIEIKANRPSFIFL